MNTEQPPSAGGLSGYAAVLRIPGLRPAIITALIGRLPFGMMGLALVLMLRAETGSYAIAGLVAAVYSISAGLVAPLVGRLIDRYGISRVVAPLAILQPLAVALMIVIANSGAAVPVLCTAGVALGVTSPPLFASIQSLLSSVAQPRGLSDAAFALEAILQEIVFLGGPIIVAVIAASSPSLAVAACGALSLVGGLSFAAAKVTRAFRPEKHEHSRLIGALSSPGVRTFVLAGIGSGFVFGTLEVAMPGFAGEHGSPSTGGLLLGMIALGSMLGGIWHGARAPGSPTKRYIFYLAVFAAALVPLALADSIAVMIPLAVIAGFFIAPGFATELALVGDLAPTGMRTEAFTWVTLTVVIGISCGNALSGVLVQHGSVTLAFLSAAAGAGSAAAVAFFRRETLVAQRSAKA